MKGGGGKGGGRGRATRRGTVTIKGLSELDAALAELSTAVQRGVLRRALIKAAQPLATAMEAKAPRRSGRLGNSIAVGDAKVTSGLAGKAAYSTVLKAGGSKAQAKAALKNANAKNAGQFTAVVSVGPRDGAAPHDHLVEFGTVERFHKSGKSVGRAPAKPFVRPAWDNEKAAVKAMLGDELRAEIDKAAARAARRKSKG